MRALVWKLSVTMPIWAPVKLMAGWPRRLDGHGHQGDGDLLAGGQQHVHLAGRRLLADLAGQRDQLVGGVAAGADDDDDLVAGLFGADGPPCRRHDPLGGRHTGAAEFLHDKGHGEDLLFMQEFICTLQLAGAILLRCSAPKG